MYFVITNNDGDTTISKVSEEELQKRLNSGYYGDSPDFFADGMMGNCNDPNYWGDSILIIKGEVCVPNPKTVIQKYTL